jgi:hypothetical protein
MVRIEVCDALGRTQSVDKSALVIALRAEKRHKWPFLAHRDGAYVIVARRSKECLASNNHEPRYYITYGTGRLINAFGGKQAGEPACTHITFHKFLGGPNGAVARAGLLLGELSNGEV